MSICSWIRGLLGQPTPRAATQQQQQQQSQPQPPPQPPPQAPPAPPQRPERPAAPEPPPLPAATYELRFDAAAHPDAKAADALNAALAAAAREGGSPVVSVVGNVVCHDTVWVPAGVRLTGASPDAGLTFPDWLGQSVNLGARSVLEGLVLTGPWDGTWDPSARYAPCVNTGGSAQSRLPGGQIRGCTILHFSGAGVNSGEDVDDLVIWNTEIAQCGDAGVQIGGSCAGSWIVGVHAHHVRHNGIDHCGSKGLISHCECHDCGLAAELFPHGDSDLHGIFQWAPANIDGSRRDAGATVMQWNVTHNNRGHGHAINGGTTCAVDGVSVLYGQSDNNGGAAYQLQGNANLDGVGDLRNVRVEGSAGRGNRFGVFVQHLGDAQRHVTMLRLIGNDFSGNTTPELIESGTDEVVRG